VPDVIEEHDCVIRAKTPCPDLSNERFEVGGAELSVQPREVRESLDDIALLA
jgi:hypothetical protein